MPAEQADTTGNKTVIIIAVAAVLITAIGVFLATGGWNYIFGGPQQTADMATEGTPSGIDPSAQTPEDLAQIQENAGAVTPKATRPAVTKNKPAPQPSVIKNKPAPQPFEVLEGRWEGTWNAGFGSSGFCSATVRVAGFTSVCYDSRFAGRISTERNGNYLFEGGNSSWSCRLSYERGRSILRCSYTVRGGPSGSSSGSLSLYKESQAKGRY
jgi:hypothetical protein